MIRYVRLFLVVFLLSLFVSHFSFADDQIAGDGGRFGIVEENDKFASGDDRHYTQGLRLSYLTSSVKATDESNDVFNGIADSQPVMFESGAGMRKIEWYPVGQSIFTPTNLLSASPSARDRPYGAWLYTGASLLQETPHETHDTLENVEVLGGVVGPLALGALTQNDFHEFIGDKPSQGWDNQIHTEPGFVLTYERKWRFEQPVFGNFGVDAIPEAGLTAGNIFTYAETGATFRLGQNLKADYGSDHIRPSLSGTGWFNGKEITSPLGWYVFAGTQGRAVARNIFLDGNSFGPTASVDKKPLVADFVGGASMFWKDDVRLDFTVTQRTKEFYSQRGHPDRFGSIGLVVGF